MGSLTQQNFVDISERDEHAEEPTEDSTENSEKLSDDGERDDATVYLEEYPGPGATEKSSAESYEATFRGIIENSATSAKKQAAKDLNSHLVKIFNNSDFSDTLISCKDGKVFASSALCRGRSGVLDSRFKIASLRIKYGIMDIDVPEFGIWTMFATIEFLNTGDIIHYPPRTWMMGLDIVKAATFFTLPDMIGIVEGYLSAYVEVATENVTIAAQMLSEALEFDCTHLESVGRLVHFLRWEWMRGDSASNLSEEALRFILKTEHIRPRKMHRADISLHEYFRFQGILKWAILRNNLATADHLERLFGRFIPDTKDTLYCEGRSDGRGSTLEWLPYIGSSAANELHQMFQSHPTCKESAVRLLKNVDWVRLPPRLLLKIVEPLQLISYSQMMDILRCHQAERPVSLLLHWRHGSNLSVFNGGFSIENRGLYDNNKGLAVCKLPNRSGEFSVWRFTIADLRCDVQLGFVFWNDLEDIETWNFDTSTLEAVNFLSKGMSADGNVASRAVHIYRQQDGRICYDAGDPGTWTHVNTASPTVEFRFDQAARTCSVQVDDQTSGLHVWTALPESSFSPALFMEDKATVRVEAISGFDIF